MSTVSTGSPALAPTVPDHAEHDARKETPRGRTFAWKLLEGLAYAGACLDPSGNLARQRIREDMARQRDRDHRRDRHGAAATGKRRPTGERAATVPRRPDLRLDTL